MGRWREDNEDYTTREPIRRRKSIKFTDIKPRCPFQGKHAYKNKQLALNVASHSMSIGRADYLRVYRCPNCHKWHLTSKLPRQ